MVASASHLNVNNHTYKESSSSQMFLMPHSCTEHIVTVNRGCFIIFDGGLIHGGAPFQAGSSTCYRFHFYIMPKELAPQSDVKTYKEVEFCGDNQFRSKCVKCDEMKNDSLMNLFKNGTFCHVLYLCLYLLANKFLLFYLFR